MRISMPRGDIRYLRFLINNPDGQKADVDFSEMYFTVKRKFTDKTFCFQKKLSAGNIVKLDTCDYQIKIEPTDTQTMNIGEYVFDVQLNYTRDSVEVLKETFVGDFVLKPEVTYPENE